MWYLLHRDWQACYAVCRCRWSQQSSTFTKVTFTVLTYSTVKNWKSRSSNGIVNNSRSRGTSMSIHHLSAEMHSHSIQPLVLSRLGPIFDGWMDACWIKELHCLSHLLNASSFFIQINLIKAQGHCYVLSTNTNRISGLLLPFSSFLVYSCLCIVCAAIFEI